MKRFFHVLPVLFIAFLSPAPLKAQGGAQGAYNQGVALFNQGKFEEALVLFEQVLLARPDFVYARNYAAKCKTAMVQNLGPKNDLEGRLSKLIVPEINFAEAPLGDVLDYFTSRSQEISGGATVVNFIYKGTAEQRSNTLINLSLRNVPMSEAIKYVGQLSRCRVKYEEHAVVIDPSPEPAPAAAPGTGTAVPPATGTPPANPFQ